MPTPRLGRLTPCPLDRRPQAVATPQPKDFSSHPTKWATRTPQGVHPSSNPAQGGLSGLVRWDRTPPGWQTQEALLTETPSLLNERLYRLLLQLGSC